MRAVVRHFLWTQRVPLLTISLAAFHSLLFWSLGPRVPLGLFIAAVMVSAWQGGLRAALLATALSTVFLAVIGHYQAPGPEEDLVLRLGLFVLVGLIAGYLSQQCRNAIRAAEHVHDLLGGSGLAIISADGEGRVTSLNPLARALTGLGDADAAGRPLAQVFRVVHGTGREPLPLPPAGAARELPEGALLLGPSGGETAVEGTVGPVRDADGRPAGVMVVFREAGGRSQAWEEVRRRADRFRALAGYAPAGLMVLDAEGRCVFCNPAAQAACGCSADECLGEGWSRHVQPRDRDRLIGDWLRAVVGKQPFADEFRVAERWLRVRSAPMLGDGGEVLGHVAALDDVTDRRRAEEGLADARRESEEHLQEWAASEQKAEEALRAARAEAEQRLLDEAGRRQQAEAVLAQALAARQHAEEELGQLRHEMRQLAAQQGVSRDEARAATQAVRDAWREEVEAVVAMHLDARSQLAEELTGHRQSLQATSEAHDRLRQDVARLEREAAEAREARDRHQALLHEKAGAEESLRQELDRLAEDAAALRQSHDRLQAVLTQKDGDQDSLRQELERLAREAEEAREVHDRLQAALAEKEKAAESLRQEVERVQAVLTEKERDEESSRRELARLEGDRSERQKAAEQLRREKEFLEGVIDGSPVGIFAHDRDGRCRVWNTALERILSRPRADALGRTAAELLPAASDKPEAGPPATSGVVRGEPATVGIGRSELLETVHAPVLDSAGDVGGGVALVRVLPMVTPVPQEDEPAPESNGSGRHTPDSGGRRLAAMRLGDIDWLAFN